MRSVFDSILVSFLDLLNKISITLDYEKALDTLIKLDYIKKKDISKVDENFCSLKETYFSY